MDEVDRSGDVRAPARPGTAVAGLIAAGSAVVALLAAAALVDPWGLLRVTTLRWAVVSTAIAVAAVAVAVGGYRPRLPRPVAAVGVGTLALVGVATVLADDRATALVGHPRRNLGLLAWVGFAAATAVGAALPWRPRIVGAAVTAAGLAITAGAAADLAGWSPGGADFAGGRVGGLSGQPAYLGSLALLVGVAAAGAAVAAPARSWPRRLAVVAAAGCAASLLATQTRGAWFGAAIAAVVALSTIRPVAARRRIAVLAGAGVLLVALVVATPLAGRLADVAAPGGTGRGRVDEWSAAAGVIRDRPVVGVGPEGYRVAVTRHLDEGYASRNGRGDVVDRAHSAPLDVAATAGLPAAAGYVALVGLVARAAIGLNRRRPGTLVAAVGAGTVGFFAAQLVLFPVPELDAVAWLAAGAVLAAAGPTPGRGPEQRWPPVAAVAAAVGLVVIAAVVGWRGVSADRSLRTAADLAAEGRRGDALAAAGRAVDAGIVDIDATYLAAGIARSGPTILDLDLAIDLTEHGLTGAPGDPALRTLHLELLVERAARSGLPDDLGRVDDAAAALAADDPTNPALCAAAGLDVLRSRPAGDGTVRAAGGCTPR